MIKLQNAANDAKQYHIPQPVLTCESKRRSVHASKVEAKLNASGKIQQPFGAAGWNSSKCVILVITFFFVAGCFKHVIFCHCTHCATAPIIGHSALKWALVTPAEEVMSIFYKDAAQNCAQVSNEAPKGVRSQVMFSWHLFIHVICCEPIDCSIAPKDHEDGNGNDDGNGQGL